MANELEHIDTAGKTIYAKRTPIVASPWGDDAVSMIDGGSVGYYSADVGSPAANYVVYEQAGVSPASSDMVVGTIATSTWIEGAVAAVTGVQVIATGEVVGGALKGDSIVYTVTSVSRADDYFNGYLIVFEDGQTRYITDFVSSTGGIFLDRPLEDDLSDEDDLTIYNILDTSLAPVTDYLPSDSAKMAGEGTTARNLDQVGDASQPRINKPAGPAFQLRLSSRADGTHKATRPARIRPGTVGSIAVSVDMRPVFGSDRVNTVGTPVVSPSGEITVAASGPRDTEAMVAITGTATADETYTVSVPVEMDSGESVGVVFDVETFTD